MMSDGYLVNVIPLYSLVELPDGRRGLLWVKSGKRAVVLVGDGMGVEIKSRTSLKLIKATALIVREAVLDEITEFNKNLGDN